MPYLIIGAAVLAVFIFALYFLRWSFCKAFYMPTKYKKTDPREFLGGEKDQFCKQPMLDMVDELEARPYERVSVRSHDGLTLAGRLYTEPNSDILEIFFHGWRGSALRDGCGAARLARQAGHSFLLVDQRAHGESDGNVITFGIKEKYDCLAWSAFAVERFGKDIRILLAGVSMGAATVLMACALPLPKQVKGISADCGYTSPEAIIRKVCRDMKIPDAVGYPFIRIGARLFGRFSMQDGGALEAIRHAKLPVLIIHGETDAFVPYSMAEELREAARDIELTYLSVPEAGHGLAFFYDHPAYVQAVRAHQKKALDR